MALPTSLYVTGSGMYMHAPSSPYLHAVVSHARVMTPAYACDHLSGRDIEAFREALRVPLELQIEHV